MKLFENVTENILSSAMRATTIILYSIALTMKIFKCLFIKPNEKNCHENLNSENVSDKRAFYAFIMG